MTYVSSWDLSIEIELTAVRTAAHDVYKTRNIHSLHIIIKSITTATTYPMENYTSIYMIGAETTFISIFGSSLMGAPLVFEVSSEPEILSFFSSEIEGGGCFSMSSAAAERLSLAALLLLSCSSFLLKSWSAAKAKCNCCIICNTFLAIISLNVNPSRVHVEPSNLNVDEVSGDEGVVSVGNTGLACPLFCNITVKMRKRSDLCKRIMSGYDSA